MLPLVVDLGCCDARQVVEAAQLDAEAETADRLPKGPAIEQRTGGVDEDRGASVDARGEAVPGYPAGARGMWPGQRHRGHADVDVDQTRPATEAVAASRAGHRRPARGATAVPGRNA